jgi:hypothetical protein
MIRDKFVKSTPGTIDKRLKEYNNISGKINE